MCGGSCALGLFSSPPHCPSRLCLRLLPLLSHLSPRYKLVFAEERQYNLDRGDYPRRIKREPPAL